MCPCHSCRQVSSRSTALVLSIIHSPSNNTKHCKVISGIYLDSPGVEERRGKWACSIDSRIPLSLAPITPSLGKNKLVHECVREYNPRVITPCSSKVNRATPCYYTVFEGKATCHRGSAALLGRQRCHFSGYRV